MTKSDKPLPSLDDLQRKIDEVRPKGDEAGGNPDTSQGLGQAMRMGVELVAGVMVGAGFGYLLDSLLSTMPLFFILCFFLGAAAGFRNMLRGVKESDSN